MWDNLIPALALVLVIEGLLPFLSPRAWREAMSQARSLGFVSMMAGVIILYFVR